MDVARADLDHGGRDEARCGGADEELRLGDPALCGGRRLRAGDVATGHQAEQNNETSVAKSHRSSIG